MKYHLPSIIVSGILGTALAITALSIKDAYEQSHVNDKPVFVTRTWYQLKVPCKALSIGPLRTGSATLLAICDNGTAWTLNL